MITLKKLTLRNFLSVGNVEQVIDLERKGLTLLLGENLDAIDGSDPNSARNGTGKSSLLNALSFVLFSYPLSTIKKDNLVNKINGREMIVTLDFEKDGKNYRIERGRKPTFTRWFVGGKEEIVPDDNETHGDSKWTNNEITKVIGISYNLFKHIFALNTHTLPFLCMSAKDQRELIEELLGITALSQKAEHLKILLNGDKLSNIEGTKDLIKKEEYRIEGIMTANQRIEKIIDDLKIRSANWQSNQKEKISLLSKDIDALSHIDIDVELKEHEKKLTLQNLTNQMSAVEKEITNIINVLNLKDNWEKKHSVIINELSEELDKLSHIDIENEILQHNNKSNKEILEKEFSHIKTNILQKSKNISNLKSIQEKELKQLQTSKDHVCPTCGQESHDEKLSLFVEQLNISVDKRKDEITKEESELVVLNNHCEDVSNQLNSYSIEKTYYKNINDAYNHRGIIEQLTKEIEKENMSINPYNEQITKFDIGIDDLQIVKKDLEQEIENLGKVKTIYDSIDAAYNHKNKLDKLLNEKIRELETANPFEEQIIQTRDEGIQIIDHTYLNDMYDLRDHQQTLLKLLTDKNSFIRKKIIDQNLTFLNHRINHYINKLGLPHEVSFNNELGVDIMYLGQSYDFGSLSRGEGTRVILALAFSFRDVWESINTTFSSFYIDEYIDSALDHSGVEAALEILKHDVRVRNRNIILISHREELRGRIERTLIARKENGFTTYRLLDECEEG
jgi:DNA repair exonuclease SbcCD ATPase subunit